MISVNAIYEDGKIQLLEDLPQIRRAKVILTVVEELPPSVPNADPALFDDLIGVVSVRDDGSRNHDRYLDETPR